MSPLPVMAVTPARNEERNLPECLRHLGGFERVVLVDSGSTDRSCELVRAAGAEVVQF